MNQAQWDGATTKLLDLNKPDLPVFSPDSNDTRESEELTAQIQKADAVILATPMYHGSYSSALKNAIDYCGFDEFEHKTVGLLAVSGGSFPISALEHLGTVCRSLDAWVLPYQAAVPDFHETFEHGELADEDLNKRVERIGSELVRYAIIQELDPYTFESQENLGASG